MHVQVRAKRLSQLFMECVCSCGCCSAAMTPCQSCSACLACLACASSQGATLHAWAERKLLHALAWSSKRLPVPAPFCPACSTTPAATAPSCLSSSTSPTREPKPAACAGCLLACMACNHCLQSMPAAPPEGLLICSQHHPYCRPWPTCSTGLITMPATVVGMPAWMAAASLNAYGGNVTAAEMEALQAEVRWESFSVHCLPTCTAGVDRVWATAHAAHGFRGRMLAITDLPAARQLARLGGVPFSS